MGRVQEHVKGCYEGVARKVAIPLFALTALGWLLVIISFGLGAVIAGGAASYPFWVVSFGGPIVIIAAVIHAALRRPYSIFTAAITTFFSVFFITALGMILYLTGQGIRTSVALAPVGVGFAGALIATIFWTAVMVLQHFYDYSFRGEEK